VSLGERLSAAAASLALALEPVVRFARPDLGRDLAGRREALAAMERWAASRTSDGPVVWLHGASAGELLGAAPTIDALRRTRDFELVVTHFSPSGRIALEHLEPDFAGFPPLDKRETCTRAIEAVGPELLVFAKLDVWPGLVAAATRSGVPVALINGVVRDGSRRLGPLSKRSFRETYRKLDLVCAASDEDAGRLRMLGARDEALRVMGDASFDLALARADAAVKPGGWRDQFEALLPDLPPGGRRLVAGSTWAADESALLEALDGLANSMEGRLGWQVVIAPHKPDEANIRRLVGACRSNGQPVERLSRLTEPKTFPHHGVIVFDQMGRLAELYTVADVAYVGGGIGGSGLHNVLEPAAAGVPVLFGDRHDRAEARELVAAGGGFASPADSLAERIAELSDPAVRERMGPAARAFVESGSGAAARTSDALLSLWHSKI